MCANVNFEKGDNDAEEDFSTVVRDVRPCGRNVGNGGGLSMQCQSCHGGMSLVGADTREGWFDEPTCQSCHTGTAVLNNGQIRYTDAFSSPGMHPVGQTWVDGHGDALDGGGASPAQCQACHGPDDRGTVLSQSHADRVLDADNFGAKNAWRGYRVGCYTCHNGPDSEDPSSNQPATVGNETGGALIFSDGFETGDSTSWN